MRLTVLGSGDASGIPRADCMDPACACARAHNRTGPSRRNSCALVTAGDCSVAIDTGLGRQDCAGLLLTHYHPDHAGFIEEFSGISAWGPDDGLSENPVGEPGVDYFPRPTSVRVVAPFVTLDIGPFRCTPLPLNHPIPVLGWAVEWAGRRLAWLTDTYGIPAPSLAWLAAHPCDLIALDTTFAPGVIRAPLRGHGDIATSLAALAAAAPGRGLLIHIGHGLQTWLDAGGVELAAHIAVAEDGQVVEILGRGSF